MNPDSKEGDGRALAVQTDDPDLHLKIGFPLVPLDDKPQCANNKAPQIPLMLRSAAESQHPCRF